MERMRKSKGLTQRKIALKTGLTQQYISQIEHGKIWGITLLKLYEMSMVLEVCPCELFRELLCWNCNHKCKLWRIRNGKYFKRKNK